jgi:RNA polymerase sigma-70 factor, ECF subfamily
VELYIFDKAYVDRLREGDPATEKHFVSYFGQLFGIMLRARMLPPERIDDIRQETFIRVIAVLHRDGGIRQPERFGAFVNSVCKNVLRENTREQFKDRSLEGGHSDLPDYTYDLERSLLSQELKAQVRDVLDELTPADRHLLRAVFLEEGDKDEICRRFGVSRDYLRVRVHRAKERFRALFQRDMPLPRRAAAKESS